jgi:hypothetical protein
VTIGVGFKCGDGIVIGSDSQITFENSHKYFENKIYDVRTPNWTAVFTFSDDADLMRVFWGKFLKYMEEPEHACPSSSLELMASVESTLGLLESADALSMIGALVVPNKDFLMVASSGRNIWVARDYEYTGIGESSLLRYLARFLCHESAPAYVYTCSQARLLTMYLIYCAKNYVNGCGGPINLRIVHPTGSVDTENGCDDFERRVKEIEDRLAIAGTLSFDLRTTETVLESNWRIVVEKIKTIVPRLGASILLLVLGAFFMLPLGVAKAKMVRGGVNRVFMPSTSRRSAGLR